LLLVDWENREAEMDVGMALWLWLLIAPLVAITAISPLGAGRSR
jgi:hypothetical protein